MEEKNVESEVSQLPRLIFGTSSLGNLYKTLRYETKLHIVEECIKNSDGIAIFDTAGKYGAGLALESLGQCLSDLNIAPDKVAISNKLGWFRTDLLTPEPTFEPGVWSNIKNDAVQKISYNGILECFHQGNQLLGNYNSEMVSVHDPDEYLAAAKGKADFQVRYKNILDAYRALHELKSSGLVRSVGIGAKDWEVIKMIEADVKLDWAMIANSLTLKSHPAELIAFIEHLNNKNISVINSAIFNGGFLTGGDFFNYKKVDTDSEYGRELIGWRNSFYSLCEKFKILPAEACVNFSFQFEGVKSIALSTTRPENIKVNAALFEKVIPEEFWKAMAEVGLLKC